MLTSDELLHDPGGDYNGRSTYIVSSLLPRLKGNGGLVLDNAGIPRHFVDAVIGCIAQTLNVHPENPDVEWLGYLLHYGRCLNKDTRADACVAVLDTWLDVYAANKDPKQHYPKLEPKQIERHILSAVILACMPKKALDPDPEYMRLVTRMDGLDGLEEPTIDMFCVTYTDFAKHTSPPTPACVFCFACPVYMNNVLEYLSSCPPGEVWAATCLRCLIRAGNKKKKFDGYWIDNVRSWPLVSSIIDRHLLAPECDLSALAHETLTTWVKAVEDGYAQVPPYHPESKTHLLMDLVVTYRNQVRRVPEWQRRAAVFLGVKYGVYDMISRWFRIDAALIARATSISNNTSSS